MIPLSFAQNRLWCINEIEGPAPTYNEPVAIRLRGKLDIEPLRTALADVVARHESLRTVFPYDNDSPWQEVLSGSEAAVPWTASTCTSQQLPAAIKNAGSRCFDLESEIPLRANLFTVDPRDHVLLLTMHHIACDGWSLGLLVRDLATAYAARRSGSGPAWEPLHVQYADYTLWQRELLGEAEDPASLMARQLAFWRTALANLPEEIALPLGRPRPAKPTYRGGVLITNTGADLHVRLVDFARANCGTLLIVFQASLAALLSGLGAGSDIPLGVPVAGRGSEALKDLVGFFVNTLVLRTDTFGDPTFRELAERARGTAMDAYSNQELPFEQVVKAINPRRVLGRHPLFQTMLVQNADEAAPHFPGLQADVSLIDLDVAKFDLTVELTETRDADGKPQGITVAAKYSTDVMDSDSAATLAGDLLHLLEAGVSAPDEPISRLMGRQGRVQCWLERPLQV